MVKSSTFKIYMAGDYGDAVRALRKVCGERGDCYSVTPCDFVFSGGLEAGVCVTRINYARFPEDESELVERVRATARFLAGEMFQRSYSIEGPRVTEYMTIEGPWTQEGRGSEG